MKNTLTAKQATSLAVFYFFCGFVLLGKFNFAGRSTWLCVLIAAIIAAIFLLFYEKAVKFFLKSKLYIVLFCLVTLVLIVFYVHTVTAFLYTCVLPGTPVLITGGFLLLFSLLFGLKGLTSIGRFCTLTLPFLAALLFFILVIPLFSINLIYVDSLLSFASPDWTPPLAFLQGYSGFTIGLGFFTLTYIVKGMILLHAFRLSGCHDFPCFNVVRNGIFFTAPLIAAIVLGAVLALGTTVFDLLNYPTYYPLGLMESGEYVQHFEIFFLIVYVFTELADLGVLFSNLFISFRVLAKK